MSIVNIAGYKFVSLDHLDHMRATFKAQCKALNLKGTVLLTPEGINISCAGERLPIDKFKEFLTLDHRFSGIFFHTTYSEKVPFKCMLIKLKKEIISMDAPGICLEKGIASTISPEAFKKMLDDGNEVTVLDTRNDYERSRGAFKNATDLNLEDFRHFPEVAKNLDEDLKEKPLVMYCTGGVRCEKAAWALISMGFKKVYQLQGGILNYFSKCGGAHYEGDCFVFDERVVVKPTEPVRSQ